MKCVFQMIFTAEWETYKEIGVEAGQPLFLPNIQHVLTAEWETNKEIGGEAGQPLFLLTFEMYSQQRAVHWT